MEHDAAENRCTEIGHVWMQGCQTCLENKVRADERERGGAIARGMVAQARRDVAERDGPVDLSRFGWAQGMTDAAAIARRHAEAQP